MCSSEYLYVIYTSQLGQRFAAGAPDPNERHFGVQNKTALKKRGATALFRSLAAYALLRRSKNPHDTTPAACSLAAPRTDR